MKNLLAFTLIALAVSAMVAYHFSSQYEKTRVVGVRWFNWFLIFECLAIGIWLLFL